MSRDSLEICGGYESGKKKRADAIEEIVLRARVALVRPLAEGPVAVAQITQTR